MIQEEFLQLKLINWIVDRKIISFDNPIIIYNISRQKKTQNFLIVRYVSSHCFISLQTDFEDF